MVQVLSMSCSASIPRPYKTLSEWTSKAEQLSKGAMKREKLFVYGTLRSNERANELLGPQAKFVCQSRTQPLYSLYQIDWYPGLVEGGQTEVIGEVWEIDSSEWRRIDEYEGVPDDYRREEIELADGMMAFAYIFIGPIDSAGLIPGGDWVTR